MRQGGRERGRRGGRDREEVERGIERRRVRWRAGRRGEGRQEEGKQGERGEVDREQGRGGGEEEQDTQKEEEKQGGQGEKARERQAARRARVPSLGGSRAALQRRGAAAVEELVHAQRCRRQDSLPALPRGRGPSPHWPSARSGWARRPVPFIVRFSEVEPSKTGS